MNYVIAQLRNFHCCKSGRVSTEIRCLSIMEKNMPLYQVTETEFWRHLKSISQISVKCEKCMLSQEVLTTYGSVVYSITRVSVYAVNLSLELLPSLHCPRTCSVCIYFQFSQPYPFKTAALGGAVLTRIKRCTKNCGY